MLFLLRLFPQFRSMERECQSLRESLQESSVQTLLLQDRLDFAQQDRSKLWEMMETAIQNERNTLQMQVNFATQQRFGVTPYPDAVKLPESMEPSVEAPLGRRQMPSERIAQQTSKFMKQYMERHTQDLPNPGPVSIG